MLYTFTGTTGQQIALQGLTDSVTHGAYVEVYYANTNGVYVQSYTDSGNYSQNTVPFTGMYVVAVVGQSASNGDVNYSFQLSLTTTPVDPLSLNTVVSGNIPVANAEHSYTFTGTAGQTLFFDGLASDPNLLVVLTDPADTAFLVNGNDVSTDVGPATMTRTGTYTLTVYGNSGQTGNYKFDLRTLASATPMATNGATTSGTLATGLTTDLYSFTGTAGQRLDIQSLLDTPVNGAFYYLFQPDNGILTDNYLDAANGDRQVTLPETGTYVIAVLGQSASNATVDYSLKTTLTTATSQPLVLNTVTTGTISAARRPEQLYVHRRDGPDALL